MTARRPVWRQCFATLAVAATGSCGGSGTAGPGPTPAAITAVTGNRQTATVGQALPQPLVVKVTDQSGGGLASVTVSWVASAGAGNVSATSTQTDAQGQAQVTWTLGHTAGSNTDTVFARVVGLSAAFTASATAGSATQLIIGGGGGQTGLVGQPLPQPLIVTVGDQYGNGVSGVSVAWGVTAGGGIVSAASVTTDPQGQASVTWTIGPDSGASNDSVLATAPGLAGSPITFTASGATTVVYTDPTAFAQATASRAAPTIVNFNELDATPLNNSVAGRTPFDGTHYASQGFTFASPGGYPLFVAPGGLSWNASNSLSVGRFPYESDTTQSATDDADSLLVTLSPGCAAASLQFLDIGIGANGSAGPADSVKFLDASGNVVQQAAFPKDYTSYRAFLGFVSTTHIVTKILVAEQAHNGDDVDYDDFTCFH